jgi:glycosyltransferase involved in cell wall biosynthesis
MVRKPSICLCMIVKDEAGVIERCLGSVRGAIDYWVICDTGSTDGTQDLVRRSLEGIPGELYERPWVDFGHNRTELMDLAQSKADYLLLLDADMTISYDRTRLHSVDADSYMIRHAEDPEYWIKRLVRGDRRWWYVGATHEYITTDGTERTGNLRAIVIHHHADSGTRAEKFERDLRLLREELAREPDNARTVFYLAQTVSALGRVEEAIDLYRRRAAMGGWPEEVFYALYQLGLLTDRVGRRAEAIMALLDAWNSRPQRAEPLYVLSWMFRERRQYHTAHLLSERGIHTPVPDDALFLHRWMYEWGLLFEYSIAAYWVGQPDAALTACDRLLAMPRLPDAYREQTKVNRTYCVQAVPSSVTKQSTSVTRDLSAGVRRPSRPAAFARPGEATGGEAIPTATILANMRHVDGWLTEEEALVLIAAADQALRALPPPHALVEVGSYLGRSTVVLAGVIAAVAPRARVHAVDPHEGEVGAVDTGTETAFPTFDRFLGNLARAGVSSYVVPIRRRSSDVDWRDPIALLYVDGLHDYENCARDFHHFEPWLARGGCAAFHDYATWPGVTTFVDELKGSGGYDLVRSGGSMVVLQRR